MEAEEERGLFLSWRASCTLSNLAEDAIIHALICQICDYQCVDFWETLPQTNQLDDYALLWK